jgi:ribose transport system ATP-binding protein
MGVQTPVLAAQSVSKWFGPVQVLFGVDFELFPGEVHGLVGENGAGKSTLMKILSGFETASEGALALDGAAVQFRNGEDGENAGVVLIHQEFNLAEQISVEANIFLGRELRRGLLLDVARMRRMARDLLAELDTDIDPTTRIADLSVSDKQMVEIAKALSRNVRVLIMDEPTAVLTQAESATLFRLIRKLKAQGVAIVFTSHKLAEVGQIADRVTVLRDGQRVTTRPAAELSEDEMANLMVGREFVELFPERVPAPADEPILEVQGLRVPGHIEDASFALRRGEVLGFAGLVGAGRTELMEAVIGLRPVAHGTIAVAGQRRSIRSPRDAARLGIAYMTEDRKGRGLLLNKTLVENLTLLKLAQAPGLFIDQRQEARDLAEATAEFQIRAPSAQARVGTLSGGNQQKLLLAKTMLIQPDIVIIDEPTRGIDIGTKQQIYTFIQRLAAAGKSCIVISSEMSELIGLCHRVVVMRRGRITGVLADDQINETEIVRHATGLESGGLETGEVHDSAV